MKSRLTNQILNSLKAFQKSPKNLDSLIKQLEVFKNDNLEVSSDWLNSFEEAWGVLEELYSGSVVMGHSLESKEFQVMIISSVNTLVELVESYSNGSGSDLN